MNQKLEIEVRGTVFECELLKDKAPRTCAAILSILPVELEGYHYFWSGQGFQIHDPILRKMAQDSDLWPDPLYPISGENAKLIPAPGDVGFFPVGASINTTYGQAIFSGPPRGYEPNYIFGKIRDLKKLGEIGKTFQKEGGQKILIRLKK